MNEFWWQISDPWHGERRSLGVLRSKLTTSDKVGEKTWAVPEQGLCSSHVRIMRWAWTSAVTHFGSWLQIDRPSLQKLSRFRQLGISVKEWQPISSQLKIVSYDCSRDFQHSISACILSSIWSNDKIYYCEPLSRQRIECGDVHKGADSKKKGEHMEQSSILICRTVRVYKYSSKY